MKKDATMFGKNFKYVLVLTALAWIVYTLPTVRAALRETSRLEQPIGGVSMVLSGSQIAGVIGGILSSLPPQPATCPSGYVCVPTSMINTWCPPNYQCMPVAPTITSIIVSPQPVLSNQKVTLTWASTNADY